MSESGQLNSRHGPVHFVDLLNHIFFKRVLNFRMVRQIAYYKTAAVLFHRVVKVRHYRPIPPRFNPVINQRALIHPQHPSMRDVHQLDYLERT